MGEYALQAAGCLVSAWQADYLIPKARLAAPAASACLHARRTKTMPATLFLSGSVLLLLLSVSIQTQDIMYLHARMCMMRQCSAALDQVQIQISRHAVGWHNTELSH